MKTKDFALFIFSPPQIPTILSLLKTTLCKCRIIESHNFLQQIKTTRRRRQGSSKRWIQAGYQGMIFWTAHLEVIKVLSCTSYQCTQVTETVLYLVNSLDDRRRNICHTLG